MNKEEIIEFLKEQLRIETQIEERDYCDYGSLSRQFRIYTRLYLGDEQISESCDSLSIDLNNN